jgi:CAAX protease family protein
MSRFPTFKRTALRLLVAFAAIVGCVGLFRMLLLPIITTVFDTGESATGIVRRTGIFLFLLLGYWLYVHFYEKRKATELHFKPVGMLLGAVAGAALVSLTTLSLFALGTYEVAAVRGWQSGLPVVACVILVAAMLEEVLFRGVIFRILEEAWGTFPALCLQSLLFAVLHLANVDAGPAEAALTVTAVTLLGAFWTLIFVHTRNLWICGLNHAAWNFAIVLTGARLSGLEAWRAMAPFETIDHGPMWLSGGAFGPENSIITLVLLILCLAGLWSRASKKKLLLKASAQLNPAV